MLKSGKPLLGEMWYSACLHYTLLLLNSVKYVHTYTVYVLVCIPFTNCDTLNFDYFVCEVHMAYWLSARSKDVLCWHLPLQNTALVCFPIELHLEGVGCGLTLIPIAEFPACCSAKITYDATSS